MNKYTFLLLSMLILWSCKKESHTNLPVVTSNEKKLEKVELIKQDIALKDNPKLKVVSSKSTDFSITKINIEHIDFSNTNDTILIKRKDGKTIAKIGVDVEGYYNEARVTEITNHNLDNVKRIISTTIEECYCGCNVRRIYILETNDENYIKLPVIEFSSVESGEPNYDYQFGKHNTIYSIEELYKYVEGNVELDTVTKESKLIWDGNKIVQTLELPKERYVVTAKNGLIVRAKPSLEGKKLDKLSYMSQVVIQEITDAVLELRDNGKTIKGHWVKIESETSNAWSSGYVFNGFLQEKEKYIKAHKEILTASTYSDFSGKEALNKLSPYWMQLYKDHEHFYLNNAAYSTKRGYSECSGDSLTGLNSQRKTLLYINDLSLANEKIKINYVVAPNKMLWQDDVFSFNFNNEKYTIKASGDYTKVDRDNGYEGKKEYILTLFSKNNSQIIFTQNVFNDTDCKIVFIGDIDQDGKPDFIIESPRHYEEERTILLMSSDAEEGEFNKKRAELALDFAC